MHWIHEKKLISLAAVSFVLLPVYKMFLESADFLIAQRKFTFVTQSRQKRREALSQSEWRLAECEITAVKNFDVEWTKNGSIKSNET